MRRDHCRSEDRWSYFKAMNETTKVLAMPVAIAMLALSIVAYPLVAHALTKVEVEGSSRSSRYPIYVKHLNSCS